MTNNGNDIYMQSPFNSNWGELRFKACVGINGGYNQETIYEGFSSAVDILFNSIKNYDGYADTLVYPVLYCFRHAIELFLKNTLKKLWYVHSIINKKEAYKRYIKIIRIINEIDKNKCNNDRLKLRVKLVEMSDSLEESIFKKRNICGHDLEKLVIDIKELYKLDDTLKNEFDNIIPLIECYAEVDPIGDAFRYWGNPSGKPHFEQNNIDIVSLDIVKRNFDTIRTGIDLIVTRLFFIIRDYESGVFTSKLNRMQIEEIAKMLPDCYRHKDNLKILKLDVIDKFGISRSEFDRAFDIIRKNRGLSRGLSIYIGLERKFLYLSKKAIDYFVKCAYGLGEWDECRKYISYDELIILITFSDIYGWRYELKRDAYYPENLWWLYKRKKSTYITYDMALHAINPQVEINYVKLGMVKCGQILYGNRIKSAELKYNIKT